MTAISVLIVEDEPAIAENIAALLTAKGYTPSAVSSGPEAFALIRKRKFDLILLDIMLPKMSGVDICKLLRADPSTADAKIIMVTGLDRMADVEEAFRAGANDYLIKPFDSTRLFAKIGKVMASP
ncbi:MAG: response regulator [Elusimicrobiota bacterium]